MRFVTSLLIVAAFVVSACGTTSDSVPAHAGPARASPDAGARPAGASPGPAGGAADLGASPRHHEWVDVRQGARTVRAFLVFPEVAGRAPAVLVIHENKGLTDWVRSVADRLGAEGFIAIAPDLLSGTGPGGGGTEAFANEDAATKGIYALPPAQVTADLDAVADRVRALPACDGTLSVAGFCWGGAQSFRFATTREGLAMACVFYGSAPDDDAALARIRCPVHGFYGGNDARINAGLPATTERMGRAGRTFEPVVYLGAGHGFMRSGEGPSADPANRAAREVAWERWLGLLRAR